MLLQLSVENFVLIDQAMIDFHQGLHVFTGETGAGKSLMVDAIALLAGERASLSLIKKDKDYALVEGVFQFDPNSLAASIAQEYGYDTTDVMVFSRQLSKDNKNTCRINHKIVALSTLKHILEAEIDIHSQHDTQYLLQEKNHIRLLDNFLSEKVDLDEVNQAYKLYMQAKEHRAKVEALVLDDNDLDFLQFQYQELEAFDPSAADYDHLILQQKQMMAFEKLAHTSQAVLDLLDQEGGLLELSYTSHKLVDEIKLDDDLNEIASMLLDGYTILSEAKSSLLDYFSNLSFDQESFDYVMSRLGQYDRLKRKHGGSISSLLDKLEALKETIYNVEHHQQVLDAALVAQQQALDHFKLKATNLSEARQKAAKALSQAISHHLKDLQLPHAQFDVRFEKANPNTLGIDKVSFYLKTNPGSDFAPLAKIASGGELSRLMLGLKVIFTPLQGCGTIIFDEIDVGVSGSVAHHVGAKMYELSRSSQTFTITHLPVVAAFGDIHFNVFKDSTPTSTSVYIEELNQKQRLEQLALLASGNINEVSLAAAQLLFDQVSEQLKHE